MLWGLITFCLLLKIPGILSFIEVHFNHLSPPSVQTDVSPVAKVQGMEEKDNIEDSTYTFEIVADSSQV